MTARDRFVETLLKLAQPAGFFAPYKLGFGILYRVLQQRAKRIKSRQLPTSGFRKELVAHGQDGQMYRHLYFHLACKLISWPGTLLSWGMNYIDQKQAATGRLESQTELLDNIAGLACGKTLKNYSRNRISLAKAREQLHQTLS